MPAPRLEPTAAFAFAIAGWHVYQIITTQLDLLYHSVNNKGRLGGKRIFSITLLAWNND